MEPLATMYIYSELLDLGSTIHSILYVPARDSIQPRYRDLWRTGKMIATECELSAHIKSHNVTVMARAMDGHPRGMERWSDRRKG